MNSDDMKRGVIPGLIAGYVFLAYVGPLMQEFIGAVFGLGALVGFVAHGFVSALLGALYTGVFIRRVNWFTPVSNILKGGTIYAIIVWIILGEILFPLMAGGDVLPLSLNTSFYGHVIFGNTLAFLVYMLYMALGLEQEYMSGRERRKSRKRKRPA